METIQSKFGKLDIIINGAAGNFLVPAEDLTTNGFNTVMNIDALGTFNISRCGFELLKKSRGVIINITATLGYNATFYQIHSSAAKMAIESMTRSFAMEWGEFGIRCVAVAPGPIKGTEGFEKLSAGIGEEAIANDVPIKRVGTKQDIADLCLFLVSDSASFITGNVFVCDGGAWLNPQGLNTMPRDVIRSFSKKYSKERKAKL